MRNCILVLLLITLLPGADLAGGDMTSGAFFRKSPSVLQELNGKSVSSVVLVGPNLSGDLVSDPVAKAFPSSGHRFYVLGPYCHLVVPHQDAAGLPTGNESGRLFRVKGELQRIEIANSRLGGKTWKYLFVAEDVAPVAPLALPEAERPFDPKAYRSATFDDFGEQADTRQGKRVHVRIRFQSLDALPQAHASALGLDAPKWRLLKGAGGAEQPLLYVPATAHGDLRRLGSLPEGLLIHVFGVVVQSWDDKSLTSVHGVLVEGVQFTDPSTAVEDAEVRDVSKLWLSKRIEQVQVGSRFRFPLVYRGYRPVRKRDRLPYAELSRRGGALLNSNMNDLDRLGPDNAPLLIAVIHPADEVFECLDQSEPGDTLYLTGSKQLTPSGLSMIVVEACHRPPPRITPE